MNKQKILDILSQILNIATEELLNLPEDTSLPEIGLSSLSFIQFIVALEEEFDIEVLDSDLLFTNFETFSKLFTTLQKYFHTDYAAKKVLICDCDNCLWHGISGEEDLYTDDASTALLNELIQLCQNGILLCLCSKNDPQNIQDAFKQLHLPLKPEHILISKANQNSKVDNIKEIARELNLSIDSFVFLDDSDYELGFINALLPEVATVKIDYTKNTFIDDIRNYFRVSFASPNRTMQYREQKEREKAKLRITDIEEYNASLQTIITCERVFPEQANRIAELSQRTNQCNLSCTRYTEADILRLLSNDNYTLIFLSVEDKYGDMGIVGAAIIRQDRLHDPFPVIESFFLSCRAFGRHFEDTLLDKVKSLFSSDLTGIYVKSDKNVRYSTFYPDHGIALYK